MNIFRTSEDPRVCAQVLSDRHVVKMALETTQILSTALQLNGCTDPLLYKMTHKGHPCVVWTSQSLEAAQWVLDHGFALCLEYTLRYGKIHACHNRLVHIQSLLRCIPNQKGGIPPKCVPDDLQDLPVNLAYRETLRRKYKVQQAKWKVNPYNFDAQNWKWPEGLLA